MSNVTIVSKNSERLVAEGGVVNRRRKIHNPPVTVEVVALASWAVPNPVASGTVTVIDVHHANECFTEAIHKMAWVWFFCHPDAKAGMWHWTVEPTGGLRE